MIRPMHDLPVEFRENKAQPYRLYGVLSGDNKLLCELTTTPNHVRRLSIDLGLTVFPRENFNDGA